MAERNKRQGAATGRSPARVKRESGEPGGGAGRRDLVGDSGVFPASGGTRPSGAGPSPDAELRGEAGWGQGERGAEGYQDSGGSELTMRGGSLLGGTTAGPSGEPTIDIHDRAPARKRSASGTSTSRSTSKKSSSKKKKR